MSHLLTQAPRLLTVIALAMALTACGGDDGATVTEIGDSSDSSSASGSGSGSSSGSASGSASASGSSSASATAEVDCSPVNPDLESEAAETVDLVAQDYAFEPAEVEVAAGVVTFAVDNQGEVNHELAFLPGGGDVPFTDDGAPDEAALEEMGAFELEAFSPGQTCNATYDLEPGEYTLFCIVEIDGETHWDLGMRGTLTVS